MDLPDSVTNSDEFGHLVDALCTKFGSTKPVARTGQPYAREVDLVTVIWSLDNVYRKCIAEKDESINVLKAEIAALRARVETMESRPSTQVANTVNWAKVVSGTTHKDENAVMMMATIASEMKRKEERINNVIVSVPTASFTATDGQEGEFAKMLAKDMGVVGQGQEAATRVKRAWRISKPTSSTTTGPVLLVVEMESTEAKIEMLRKSKNLRNLPNYKDVYVNEDLTPSERITHRKLREERD